MTEFKHGTKEYWYDWYWNRGGREKVKVSRKARGFDEYKIKD